MVERLFETARVGGPGSHAAALFGELFRGRVVEGYRLEAISLAGTYPRGGLAALTWIRVEGPRQHLGEFVTAHELRAELANLENRQFGPALATAMRAEGGDEVFLVVYERVPSGTLHWPRLFWESRDFLSFKNEMFDFNVAINQRHQYLRSAFVLESLPASPRAPRFIGTMWPYAGAPFEWGVTYWYATELMQGVIQNSGRARAMAVGGRPWIVAPALEEAPGLHAEAVRLKFLAVWRDIFMTPWPKPHPMSPDAGRELDINIGWINRSDLEDVRRELEGKGNKLLSWAVRGPGGDNVHFALNWVPAAAEIQQRTFVMTGPGDLSDAVDTRELKFVGDRLPEADSVTAPWRLGRTLPTAGLPRPDPPGVPGLPGEPGLEDAPPWELEEFHPFPTHPLDVVMWKLMRQVGARAGSLAVNRRGQLRFSRAYTWAETGYPITKTYHRTRIGSVSKSLTALMLVPYYLRKAEESPSDLGLDRRFGAELDIARDEPAFTSVTIRQALAHTSGIAPDPEEFYPLELVRPNDVPGVDANGDPWGPSFLRPGETRLALEAFPGDLVTLPAGTDHYNNTVYAALSELCSNLFVELQRWDRYDEALQVSLLVPADIDLASGLTGDTYERCNDRNEVAYHPFPLEISRPDADTPEKWTASPYVFDVGGWSGSGGVSLGMRELMRVFAMLTPRAGSAYMTPEEKWIMAGRPTVDVIEPPLGWNSVTRSNLGYSNSDPQVPGQPNPDVMLRLYKAGAVGGNGTHAYHWFPGPGSTRAADDTVDIGMTLNCNGEPDLSDLIAAVQAVELQGLWSPEDLTDGSDFDEEEP